ncbi:MAG: DNA-formamidopyrimidine glycosylase [Parcubacteria group bacterium RIFCSPLOWO2_01_FULL_40_65]|nr:MAG: DNA-formamidopyrimidine glycosylase [Parcubacteria group bacterium RIFCSPHIGHO2_01_FULL_40_30]OHB19077.1 MAG: DNA-formamidopyrimidine glycosylase [Parcubacteria group bacterium RIFCSPHIGHO2_02_FULL_40_12]OHB21337.1 MAG: DNA-formamidopyrimidine glycosylase [Parcubacteria group bacterium RIFCSPLOWO2_01_FULL_40_65]OHB23052.1 MAG: DNA-formamidopyrimidine glycosylase [Parcubacteria group bacterium RIFCSPLOWO2_02_FULL_40_12]
MPELPEVETIARELKKRIIGLKIIDVWADKDKPFRQSGGLKKFLKEVENKKIVDVRRRAKFVVIDLEGPRSIFIHQKISGHLLYGKWKKEKAGWKSIISGPLKNDLKNKYLRIIFFLNNDYQVALSDLRRFGKMMLVGDEEIENLKELKKLGPEPLEISFGQFKNLFTKKKGRLKPVLMDPYFIAGIGNIYSDEILWDAGYHPLARVEKLKENDLKKIFNSMIKVLNKAIKYQGDSMDDYRLPSGGKGHYQEIQNAYQQTGKKCKKKDGGIIQRLKVASRSAHFCPVHQKI